MITSTSRRCSREAIRNRSTSPNWLDQFKDGAEIIIWPPLINEENMRQVSFSLVKVEGNFVYISDDGLPGFASVTNQAEHVVETLISQWGPDKRFFYRDTMFVWDELCHDGTKFTDFKPVDNREHEDFLGQVILKDAG